MNQQSKSTNPYQDTQLSINNYLLVEIAKLISSNSNAVQFFLNMITDY
jgi:hypothetical protein